MHIVPAPLDLILFSKMTSELVDCPQLAALKNFHVFLETKNVFLCNGDAMANLNVRIILMKLGKSSRLEFKISPLDGIYLKVS